MSGSRTLTFLWTSWSIAFAVIGVLVTIGIGFVAWRRSGYRRSIGFLELFRLAIVAAVAVLYNQPEYIEEIRPEERPTIAVLWDDSPSMETRDVVRRYANAPTPQNTSESRGSLDEGGGGLGMGSEPESRRAAAARVADPEAWSELGAETTVVIQPFSDTVAGASSRSPDDVAGSLSHGSAAGSPSHGGGRSNLHEPLASAPRQFKNLHGIVFVTDGDWNEGDPPVAAAVELRSKNIPVFVIPVGSTSRLPDVELLSLDAPTFGIAGKSVRIPFTIESSLPREYRTTVVLRTSDGDEVTKEVSIVAMGRTNDAVLWKPQKIGDYTLTLDIPAHTDETLKDNNTRTAPISIREEKLRVLVVESIPRWEYRYLRNALSRDPGVDVACLLFHPGLDKVGGGNKDYIKQFPEGLDELAKFDVVFLGDVGTGDGQLTVEQCRLLKGLVEHQASGLVFMPGWQGRQFSLLETELDDLFPVMLDELQPGGWGSRTPNHFELTTLGRRSLLTKLADTEEDNIEVWEELPGFQWYAPVLRAKAGSDVLCVHQDATNEFGRLPLLATRTFGAGKVLFMGTDGAWRWRKGVEDKYHYRFWGQVVRWMAYQRNMAKGETMRLYYSPDQPQLRQVLTLNANVMEKSGEPLTQGDVSARIVAPSGNAETVRLTSAGDEWGAFSGRFSVEEPGKHQVTLICKQTGATLDASFFVQGVAKERVGRPIRLEVLEEIADVTRGKVMNLGEIGQIVRLLANLPEPPPTVRRLQLWSHPVVAGLLVALLGAFWVARKMVGLI